MVLFITLGLLLAIIFLIYLYFTWNFNYWKKKGVAGPEPKFLIGTFPSAFSGKRNIIYDFEDSYKKYKNKEKYIGVFLGREPQLVVLAPDLVHDVFVTKFRNFYDNNAGHMYNEKYEEVFGLNPFFLKGQEWKIRRAEITPALTINRIKASYPVMEKVGYKLVDFIKEQIRMNGKNYSFDAKEFCQRYTVQTVSDCVYGIDAGALTLNVESQMLKEARNMLSDFIVGFEKLFLLNMVPVLTKFINVEFMRKSVKLFFTNLMHDAINLRKKTQIDRVDFLNYVMQLKEKKGLNDIDMLAHFISFFADGFETSAGTLAFTLLCLGRNPDIQTKLRKEIESSREIDGSISFEKLHELPLLNACIYETLRLFSVLTFSSKICTEETTFTNYDGSILQIQKGTVVNLPILCLHYDEEYFPDPYKYDPERFIGDEGGEKKYRDMGVFAPFGDGPRICLGQKFGISQVKSGICEILRNFEIIVDEKTRKDNQLCAKSLISNLVGGIWLQLKELKN